jgi:hypothetical protein
MTKRYLEALEDMHAVAHSVSEIARQPNFAGRDTLKQLSFLGDDNLKNRSAIENLMEMGCRKGATAMYVNAGMTLNHLLPGVAISVLGPPTLEQSDSIRKMRAKDPGEFWQFRSYWAFQALSAASVAAVSERLFSNAPTAMLDALEPNVRWFIDQARSIHADQLLQLVRDLDSVMNNTSIILLMKVGSQTLLFPGDAQIENWAYALNQQKWRKALTGVNLYKVGHHGSLNATPKSLWKLFRHKGGEDARGRLKTVCSTKSGKHGNPRSGTEVPRATLVKELEAESTFMNTEQFRGSDLLVREISMKFRSNPRQRTGRAHLAAG